MIVVVLKGGLGNQMFQYAAGKALALHHQTELFLDLSFLEAESFGAYTKRDFALGCFELQQTFANEEQISAFKNRNSGKFKRVLNRMFPGWFKELMFYESGQAFYKNFFDLPSNTYIDGYWQSEKYFINYRRQILEDFKVKLPLPEELQYLLQDTKTTCSVAIHVRRGDYVSDTKTSAFHGCLNLEYYNTALEKITSDKSNIKIFVFSDDIKWCREHLDIKFPSVYVNHNFAAHWDMYLMSQCKHNIIANSSFSWWGAWLNENPDKIVVAPSEWFRDIKSEKHNIIPEDWMII